MSMQNQNMSLVLSTDAKPRLKWTPELHQRFIEAVNHLGGPDKATPKGLTRVMGIPGLTLYHLKSHLQKYRLGKSEQSSETCIDVKQEDYREIQSRDMQYFISSEISDATPNQINEGLQMAQALQMQMEVQRKLYEQIEVQRHLQLRIEAQGKYLQSVLKTAQETLAGYSSSSLGVELAKAELSRLVSMVNTGCPSSPISELTETRDLALKDHIERKQLGGTMCSTESSLTSSESSGRKEEKQPKNDTVCVELPLINIHPEDRPWNRYPSTQAGGRKRSRSTISDGNCVELPSGKRSPNYKNESDDNKLRKAGLSTMLDLNSQYQKDIDSGPKAIDLNDSVTSVLEP